MGVYTNISLHIQVYGFSISWNSDHYTLDGIAMPLESRTVAFVLVELLSASTEEIEAHLSSAIDLAIAHEGTVDTIVSNLVVVGFGLFDNSPVVGHEKFITSVLAKFGKKARVSYGVGLGGVGNVGNAKRMAFTCIHPLFPKALAALTITVPGDVQKVS